jgi:DNA-binding NarL/FixJ family response regulator
MKDNCIVLGDRHQNILEGLRGLLETLFGSVVMVADQQSLFKALDKIKPKFAIVDLSLLGHDGINSESELNKRFPDVKFIILSNYDEPEVVDDVMSTGVSGFVLKQYAGTDLFDAIKNVQKGQIFISPAVKNKRDSQDKNERKLK